MVMSVSISSSPVCSFIQIIFVAGLLAFIINDGRLMPSFILKKLTEKIGSELLFLYI